jgi:hypothetical protein
VCSTEKSNNKKCKKVPQDSFVLQRTKQANSYLITAIIL